MKENILSVCGSRFAVRRNAAGLLALMFLILSLTLLLEGCGKNKGGKSAVDVIPVKAMKIELRDLNKTIEYAGSIKGQDEAMVYPKVSGKIIEKIKDEGSSVNKGDTILFIDRDEVGLKFEKAPVESPLGGIVGRIYQDIGSNVTPQTPVAFVTNMTAVKIELNIPEKYLPDIALGKSAIIKVDVYPDEVYTGKITKISPVLDIDTRSAPIEITIDDPKRLLQSGMFAKVSLILEERNKVPVILKESIIGREPDTYVYVIDNDLAAARKITLGVRQGPYFEVTDGLKEGDMVVVVGQQKLRSGVPVRVEIEEKGYNR